MKENQPDSLPGRDGPEESPREPVDVRLWVGALALSLTLLLVFQRQIAFFVDDAFITFRFARNWAEWGTPVFNAFELAPSGQPVEGFSNLLWAAVLAAFHRGGLDLPGITATLQFVFAALTVVLVARFARVRLGLGPIGQIAAPLVLATSAPFVAWSSGGMETSLFTLLLAGLLFEALRQEGDGVRRGLVLSAQLGALGAGVILVRAEGVLWVLGVGIAVAAGEFARSGRGLRGLEVRRRRLLIALVIVGVVTLAQALWRQSVYGAWLPNTVAAKTGGGIEVMGRGARQVASWALICVTPIAAVVLAVPALRHTAERARVAAAACLVLALGFATYNVLVGGDWMPFFRFLAPAAPALALVVAIGVDALPRRAATVIGVVVVGLQPLSLFDVHAVPTGLRESLRFRSFKDGYTTEAGRVVKARENAARFERLGLALAAGTSPGDILAFGPIGAPGWFAPDLDFVDRNGLVTPSVAAREIQAGGGTAGHEKRVPHAWFLDNGSPQPNLLFATWLEGLMDPTSERQLGLARNAIRGLLGSRPRKEGPLYGRTVLRAVPIAEGPAAGCTLLLLERATPEAAQRFWGG